MTNHDAELNFRAGSVARAVQNIGWAFGLARGTTNEPCFPHLDANRPVKSGTKSQRVFGNGCWARDQPLGKHPLISMAEQGFLVSHSTPGSPTTLGRMIISSPLAFPCSLMGWLHVKERHRPLKLAHLPCAKIGRTPAVGSTPVSWQGGVGGGCLV